MPEPKTKNDTQDEQIEEMLKTWDIVKCKYCKKDVSMLDAQLVEGGQYFICNKHLGMKGEQ